MGRTSKYYPSRAFSCQRHICTTLTRKLSVAGLGAVVLYNEFREFSEFSKLGCIRRSHPKLSKFPIFPIFRNQCLLSFRQLSFRRFVEESLRQTALLFIYCIPVSQKKSWRDMSIVPTFFISLHQHWFSWACCLTEIKRESGENPEQFPLL